METTFSVGGVFKESYAIIKPRFWKVVGQYALIFVAYFVLRFFSNGNFLLSIVLSTLLSFISVVFCLSYIEKGRFAFESILETLTFKKFVTLFFAMILAWFFIIAGLVLLIIPGVIILVQLYFYKYLIVESDVTPMAALKGSRRLTKGNRSTIFEYILIAILINILGALCLVVGLFFTIPLTLIGFTLIYKKLAGQMNSGEEVVEVDIIEVVNE